MKKFLIYAACFAAIVLVFAGCKEDEKPIDFYLIPESLVMIVGDVVPITVNPANAGYTYESNAPGIVFVNSAGLVTAVSTGNARIRVSLGSNTKEVAVTVGALNAISEIDVGAVIYFLYPDETVNIAASVLPANHNEKGTVTFQYRSSNNAIATVDFTGKITAIGSGIATITVSLEEKPTVKTEIVVVVTTISEIEVIPSSPLSLMQDETIKVTPSLLPENYNEFDVFTFKWETSNAAVATVDNDGNITGKDAGIAVITVSLVEIPTIKTEIRVLVSSINTSVLDISLFTTAGVHGPSGAVRSRFTFENGIFVQIEGINEELIPEVYNRDFFTYCSVENRLTFVGESGEYDVMYSATNRYIWVYNYSAVAPEAYWVIGSGFTPTPFSGAGTSNWGIANMLGIGYMMKIEDDKYQASINLRTSSINIQIRSERGWGGAQLPSVTGPDAARFNNSTPSTDSITASSEFEPGYYLLIYDSTENTLSFEKID